MSRPRIRHLALYAPDTRALADFYMRVFDMEEMRAAGPPGKGPVFLTDGHVNLAILPLTAKGEAAPGLNHFGFEVDDRRKIERRLAREGVAPPELRPAGRYAELRAADPMGNIFDLSEGGFVGEESEKRA